MFLQVTAKDCVMVTLAMNCGSYSGVKFRRIVRQEALKPAEDKFAIGIGESGGIELHALDRTAKLNRMLSTREERVIVILIGIPSVEVDRIRSHAARH